MKKLLACLLLICFCYVSIVAQDKKAVGKTAKKEAAKASNAAGPVKADGTADMRYKANKEKAKAAKPTGPVKADGTPDMRYKENKPKKG